MTGFRRWLGPVAATFGLLLLFGCEGCEKTAAVQALSLPFQDNFDRPSLGQNWFTERPGRWQIEYDTKTKKGHLCVWQSRNMPLFLRKTLPRNVVIEFDAVAHHREGDVKVELFTDGRFHATGYVLVHGGWNNKWSIIDRLDEHNRNCKYLKNRRTHENNLRVNCRKIKRGGPVQNRRYRWKIIRSGDTVQWFIDNRLFLKYQDPMPLEGKSHRHFAFSNWISRVCFDNLKISKHIPRTVHRAPRIRPKAPAPLRRAAAIPTAPTPRTAGTQPKPLQPKASPVRRTLAPKYSILPSPHTLRLNAPKKNAIRIYRPKLQPPSPGRKSMPRLYQQIKIKRR